MSKLIAFCVVLASAVSAWAHFPIHVGETSADDGLLDHNQSSAVPWLSLFNYSWGEE